MLVVPSTDPGFVGEHQAARATWQCDCMCGWSSHRLNVLNRDAASRAASMHLRVCPLLDHSGLDHRGRDR
jgi:hypothetical protein